MPQTDLFYQKPYCPKFVEYNTTVHYDGWSHSTVSFSATSFKGNLKAGESLPFKLENKKAVMITTDSALVTKYDAG